MPLYILVACLLAAIIGLVVLIRLSIRESLRKQECVISEEISRIPPFREQSEYEKEIERLSESNESTFIDIPTDFAENFQGKIISSTEENNYIQHYTAYFDSAYFLLKKLKAFAITPSETLLKFINDYSSLRDVIKIHNEKVIQALLTTHKDFFDHCLKYPLDKQQRRSIVSEEDNCLVISSAGSGKTSSIVGKVKYLLEIKKIEPSRLLLISYTNKAALELTERISTPSLKGYTFHKLAIDIIAQSMGVKPSICDNTDALFVGIFHELSKNKNFKENVLQYLANYQVNEADWERRKNERREQLSELKSNQLKALFPDMDGKPIYVRSEQEKNICFVLSSLCVKFRYEESYEYEVADETHSQYRPDFSIYFEQNGKQKRIYLEHFGINEQGHVPAWFSAEKDISYEEKNQAYNDGINWKKVVHEKYGTELLFTTSADFQNGDIREKIKNLLLKANVPFNEIDDADLYDLALPKGSKQEKAFIRLVATFVTLAKSGGKSLESVLRKVANAQDRRNEFIIKNIFKPVYERYIDTLKQRGQIDFTDAILWATEICKLKHPVAYDYIIVDEFQDISIDRYNFLKALRDGNPSAKLYCVGDDWQSIYRFSGSDMTLFNRFSEYFGFTEINKIETTYRFGNPLVSMASGFIQRNKAQIQKDIHPFNQDIKTELEFYAYERRDYCKSIGEIIDSIPSDKSIFLLGRYSFDDYYLSFMYQGEREGNKFFYYINGRKIEFLTVHKSKGLEADYVILLQCNKDIYGFPSLVSDDPVLNYVLTESDQFPMGEERRLFYVAITRAKVKTLVLYDKRFPSIFVDEFLHPEKEVTEINSQIHPNANKRWTKRADQFLLQLYNEGKSIKYIAAKMGRSQTAIRMRLEKIGQS